jgi:hypothetical protein
VSAPVDIASSLSQSPAIERLVELGFREDDIDALAEDFLAMQCRIDPQGMHRRLKEQLQAQAILSKSPVELGLDGAIDAHIEHQAAMPPNYKWVS